MKTIEERAEAFTKGLSIDIVEKMQQGIETMCKNLVRMGFFAGAKSEFDLHTKWHPLTEFPRINKQVLIKYQFEKNGSVFYTIGSVFQHISTGELCWITNDDILKFNLDFVWREIYE